MAQPTIYSEELTTNIINRLINGESLNPATDLDVIAIQAPKVKHAKHQF